MLNFSKFLKLFKTKPKPAMFVRGKKEIEFSGIPASELAKEYGAPLYIYDEATIRDNCKKLKGICNLPNFRVYYSAKANSNVALLQIIKSEGLHVDAMSLGEIYLEKLAGFQSEEILFLSNNVSDADFTEVIKQKIRVCLDSIDQIESYASLNPNSEIYIRINPGEGDGHHKKVITAGKVKFGIEITQLQDAFAVAESKDCKITGFMIHIGSLFLESNNYLKAIQLLLDLAKKYPSINYIDFGGGIGIPYNRKEETPFPFADFSKKFTALLQGWMSETGRTPTFAMEPGRFVVAEAGAILTEVMATKQNHGVNFAGTNLGFNFLLRPEFYDAYHEILAVKNESTEDAILYNVVGNVCESGDNIGKDRLLPKVQKKDLLLVRDAGAYGYAMASNYNSMGRPAEVLITADKKAKLIRKRESLEDLSKNQIY